MTTESTQPQSELGPAPAAGPGQSQGHRRRRRRRKNKSSQAGAPQAQQAQPQAQAPVQQAPPPKAAAPVQQQSQPRKKKKFFQKNSPPPGQPGNNAGFSPGNGQGSGMGKRKVRQKGPREFVGPMDHSYRAVNGNVSDGPPSTIQLSNGHSNGSRYQENYSSEPTIAVKADAVTRIFCFI